MKTKFLTALIIVFLIIVGIIFYQKSQLKTSTGSTNISQKTPELEIVATGLNTVWQIAEIPDGRIIFTQRNGIVKIIENNTLLNTDVINLGETVSKKGEGGLLGIAVDPDFLSNKFIYLYFTFEENSQLKNRLVRYEEKERNTFKENQILINNIPGGVNHNGGVLAFGPDKKLYVGVGERYETSAAQDLNDLGGKILRLNNDGTIPADNPFENSYIWSYGHRNPQGLAWSTDGKVMYSTEHGPSGSQGCCKDEINIIQKGKNYGWPEITGDEIKDGMVSPAWFSGENMTWAPGDIEYISKGKMKDNLIFTGLRGQALYKATLDSSNPDKITKVEEIYKDFGRLRAVIQLSNGDILFSTSNKDGRGKPADGDDKIIRVRPEP